MSRKGALALVAVAFATSVGFTSLPSVAADDQTAVEQSKKRKSRGSHDGEYRPGTLIQEADDDDKDKKGSGSGK